MKTRITSSANTRSKKGVRLAGPLPEKSKTAKKAPRAGASGGTTSKRQPRGKSDVKIMKVFGLTEHEEEAKKGQPAGTSTRAQTSARTRGGKLPASSRRGKSIPRASTSRRLSEGSATHTAPDVAEAAEESSDDDLPLSVILSRRNSEKERASSAERVRSRSRSRRPSEDATRAGATQAAKVTEKRKSREGERSGEGAGSRRPSQDATRAGATQAAKVTEKRKSREAERSGEGAGGGAGSRRPSQDATRAGATQAAKVTEKRKSGEAERSGEGVGSGAGSRRPSQDATRAGATQAAKVTERRKSGEVRPTSSAVAKSTTHKRKDGHGKSLTKRHQRPTATGLKKPEIRRLARRGGVKRLSATIYIPMQARITNFTQVLIEKAMHYMHCAKRKTITPMDIVYSLKCQNRTLYGYGG